MPKWRIRCEFLADDTAHEHVARIGHKGDDGHLEVGGIGGNDREGGVFAGGGIVEEAGQKALEGREAGVPGGNAKGEGDDEISQGNRDAVMDAFEKHIPAGLAQWQWYG